MARPPHIQLKALIKLGAVNSLKKRLDLDVNMPLEFDMHSYDVPFTLIIDPETLTKRTSPLFYACYNPRRKYEICQILIERGAKFRDENEKDYVLRLYAYLINDFEGSATNEELINIINIYNLLLVNHNTLELSDTQVTTIRNTLDTYQRRMHDEAWSSRGPLIKHHEAATRRRKYNQRKSRKWRQQQRRR